MADFLFDQTPQSDYVDRKVRLALATEEEYLAIRSAQLAASTTVYLGNLSFYTSEAQIKAHMGSVGPIRDIVMGLNSQNLQPCGFCFVEYVSKDAAAAAVAYLHLSRLDDRVIRVTWDVGQPRESGRIWGRGFTGAQTRDEYRQGLDKARGGFSVRRAVETGVERTVAADEMVTYSWVVKPPVRGPKKQQQQLGGAFAEKDRQKRFRD